MSLYTENQQQYPTEQYPSSPDDSVRPQRKRVIVRDGSHQADRPSVMRSSAARPVSTAIRSAAPGSTMRSGAAPASMRSGAAPASNMRSGGDSDALLGNSSGAGASAAIWNGSGPYPGRTLMLVGNIFMLIAAIQLGWTHQIMGWYLGTVNTTYGI